MVFRRAGFFLPLFPIPLPKVLEDSEEALVSKRVVSCIDTIRTWGNGGEGCLGGVWFAFQGVAFIC